MSASRSYKTGSPLLLGFLLLFCCAASATWLSQQRRQADEWVRHTLEVENRLSNVQVLTTRAEINRRGFLLTGSPQNLSTFLTTRRALTAPMASLEAAVADNAPQKLRSHQLVSVIAQKLDEMSASMELYRSGQRSAAAAVISSAPSRLRTQRLLMLVDAMRSNEEQLLAARTARSRHFERYAEVALVLGALLTLGLALLVSRERQRRLIVLAEINEALERDIVARKLLEQDLDAARIRAELAGRAKTNFLANMSHEIRTPMNGVVGFTDLLLASILTPEQRRQTELIADSGRAMMRLLNDILDLSKVEAGQMKVSIEPFDLLHSLKACTKLMAPAIEQRGIAFRCALQDDLPKIVLGDGLRLRQIILNLLGNATKFTLEGEIGFAVRQIQRAGAAMIEIAVTDTGIGIAPEHQAAVFDHFVQADADIAPRFGGTGLGLAISNEMARLMGGDLVLSSAIGKGSCFRLTLPLCLPTANTAFSELQTPSTSEASPSLPLDPAFRVLVAEDHDVNQLLMMEMLSHLGIRAELAQNGEQAVDMVVAAASAGEPFSLILMDMQMPRVDGCEATLRLRAKGFGPAKLPIVALTANAYADDVSACLNAGMQAHLSKPIKSAELNAAIRRWAARPTPPHELANGGQRFSAAVRERYAARRQELIETVAQVVGSGTVSDGDAAHLADILHKFAGSAEMFGDAVLGEHARVLEAALASCTGSDRIGYARAAAEGMQAAA